ncbi:MAG: cation:proton antiporter, partial [Chitinophagaceae bacterium]|nr:cation:proton antiporter [Chitinophagaceae bacterium]
ANGIPLRTAIGYGVLVTVVLIAARIISSYAAMIATFIFRPGVAPRASSRKRQLLIPLLLGWTGMRGVVSLAAALAIPVTLENGAAFPHRNLILFITFVVILLTLSVQGLTLPYFIRRSQAFHSIDHEEAEDTARQQMKQNLKEHTYRFLKNKHEQSPDAYAAKMLQHWEEKSKAPEDSRMNDNTKAILYELLESQRRYLAELNKDAAINEEIIRQQLYQIDLEEERLKVV